MVHLTKLFTVIPLSNYLFEMHLENIIDLAVEKLTQLWNVLTGATLVNGRFYTTDELSV